MNLSISCFTVARSCFRGGRTVCDLAVPDGSSRRSCLPGERPAQGATPSPALSSCRAPSICTCISSRQGYFTPARTAGRRPRDGGRGKRRRDQLYSLSPGDGTIRRDFRGCRRAVKPNKARGSISAITLSFRRRRSSPRPVMSALGAPCFKIFMNNRGGEGPPRLPDLTTAFCSGCEPGRGQKWRHGLSPSGDDRMAGCCATG